MKKIYIILTQSGTGVSKLLKFFSHEKYNHSSICFDDAFKTFYSFGRKKVNNPFTGGLIQENAFTHVFGKFPNIPCLILEKEISDIDYENGLKIIENYWKQKDTFNYAYLGIALVNTKITWANPKRFFCSQFVAQVLKDMNLPLPKSPEHMHPLDFTKLEGAKPIYEGELHEFCSMNREMNEKHAD